MQTMLLATNTENNSSSQQSKNVLENCKPLNIFFFVDGWLITRCTVLVAGIFIKKPFKKNAQKPTDQQPPNRKILKIFSYTPNSNKPLIANDGLDFFIFLSEKKRDKKTNDDFGNNAAFND